MRPLQGSSSAAPHSRAGPEAARKAKASNKIRRQPAGPQSQHKHSTPYNAADARENSQLSVAEEAQQAVPHRVLQSGKHVRAGLDFDLQAETSALQPQEHFPSRSLRNTGPDPVSVMQSLGATSKSAQPQQRLMPSTTILKKLYPWLFSQESSEMTVEYARLVSSIHVKLLLHS